MNPQRIADRRNGPAETIAIIGRYAVRHTPGRAATPYSVEDQTGETAERFALRHDAIGFASALHTFETITPGQRAALATRLKAIRRERG